MSVSLVIFLLDAGYELILRYIDKNFYTGGDYFAIDLFIRKC